MHICAKRYWGVMHSYWMHVWRAGIYVTAFQWRILKRRIVPFWVKWRNVNNSCPEKNMDTNIFWYWGRYVHNKSIRSNYFMGKGQAFPALLSFDWQLSSSIMHIIWAICGGRAGLALQNHSKVSGIQKFSPKLKSLHHQPWSNVHGHQLLEKQLRSVG